MEFTLSEEEFRALARAAEIDGCSVEEAFSRAVRAYLVSPTQRED
ncbi:hypothetical protein [Gryllotalpicola koreensis]